MASDVSVQYNGEFLPEIILLTLCDRPLLFVYFQVNNGVLYCFWIMKILVIMVLCCARFNYYCIVFVFIV